VLWDFKSWFTFDANPYYFKLEQSSQLLRILLITTTLASLALGHSILATQDTYSQVGTKRIHLGRLDEILPPPFPQPSMEKFYSSTPTRNVVGCHYCCHVSPQTFGAVPTSEL
jgi:hypothetical protein